MTKYGIGVKVFESDSTLGFKQLVAGLAGHLEFVEITTPGEENEYFKLVDVTTEDVEVLIRIAINGDVKKQIVKSIRNPPGQRDLPYSVISYAVPKTAEFLDYSLRRRLGQFACEKVWIVDTDTVIPGNIVPEFEAV